MDSNDIERERGITIKLNTARMKYTASDGQLYALNLIDTPGHVDFSYEVSRSLAACEGALLVVDASQGVEAQTLANLWLALENDLEVVVVLNKIDLPAEIEEVTGIDCSNVLMVSAKMGIGIEAVLESIVKNIPPPKNTVEEPCRALIFDSYYDAYLGVVCQFKITDGYMRKGDTIRMMNTGKEYMLDQVPVDTLYCGEVGWLAASIKSVKDARVGDTITQKKTPAEEPLPGYQDVQPMVYCGLFPVESDDYQDLRESLEKLQLNDSALQYEPEVNNAMGFGFRCGFLGLLHMEIVQERLEREYGVNLITTAPTVVYKCMTNKKEEILIMSPSDLPPAAQRDHILEPYCRMEIGRATWGRVSGGPEEAQVTGPKSQGAQSITQSIDRSVRGPKSQGAQSITQSIDRSVRGPKSQGPSEFVSMQYLTDARTTLVYDMPLAEVVSDFFDELKSRSKGYASMEKNDLVLLEIKINNEPADPLSVICHKDNAYKIGKGLAKKLKELIPRQMFRVPIQACIGVKVIASEAIAPYRKDVLAKCYGGDISRKKKLLSKQAAGKKRMKTLGKVEVPQEAFMAVLKINETDNS
eukprot:gene20290-27048_t